MFFTWVRGSGALSKTHHHKEGLHANKFLKKGGEYSSPLYHFFVPPPLYILDSPLRINNGLT